MGQSQTTQSARGRVTPVPRAWCVGVTWAWSEHQTAKWHQQEVYMVLDSCSAGSQVRDSVGRRPGSGV